VLDAGNGADAIRMVGEDPGIDVLVLDWNVPGSGGERILREIKERRPEVEVIVWTGMAASGTGRSPDSSAVFTRLEKPCELQDLIAAIEAAHGRKTGP
jgi:DNA-binding NtrC family response regulator